MTEELRACKKTIRQVRASRRSLILVDGHLVRRRKHLQSMRLGEPVSAVAAVVWRRLAVAVMVYSPPPPLPVDSEVKISIVFPIVRSVAILTTKFR